MHNDQLVTQDVDNIPTYGTAGSKHTMDSPMRYFVFHNPSTTRGLFVSWNGVEDSLYVPPGKQLSVNGRSQVEKFFLRADGAAGAAMVVHVSCSAHAPLFGA